MAYTIGKTTNTSKKEAVASYKQAFTIQKKLTSLNKHNTRLSAPVKILGKMQIPQSGYFVDHTTPDQNIIHRDVPNPIFDIDDVEAQSSSLIYELLPKEPKLPNAPPISLNVYVANWARIHNFGGVTDSNKDPRIDSVKDWTINQWTVRHKWPSESTLDPTYVFYTQDPALFYTQKVISHYKQDEDGNIQPVMVGDNDIVWKLDGKEVHRGWYMDLSGLSRTVQVVQGQAVIIPRLLSIEATNSAGIIRKEIKFAAIDSDDGALISGDSESDNFTSTFSGQFIADEDPSSEDYRSAVFWPDPRYGPRDVYIRFYWNGFDTGKSRRRKFRKSKPVFKVDGKQQSKVAGQWVYDNWTKRDERLDRHQDALSKFPEIFNNDGRVKSKYANKGGGQLSSIGVTNWTGGRKSALFVDEPDFGCSHLFKFKQKPGPFDLSMYVGFKVKKGGWFSKRHTRYWQKTLTYTGGELNLNTPLQPIDLGVVKIDYRHKE